MTDYACSKCGQKIIGSAIADIATLDAANKAQTQRIAELEAELKDMTMERDHYRARKAEEERKVKELSREIGLLEDAYQAIRERGKG
jgi:predicted  nucleic acid-binding Zn-ribbon protein